MAAKYIHFNAADLRSVVELTSVTAAAVGGDTEATAAASIAAALGAQAADVGVLSMEPGKVTAALTGSAHVAVLAYSIKHRKPEAESLDMMITTPAPGSNWQPKTKQFDAMLEQRGLTADAVPVADGQQKQARVDGLLAQAFGKPAEPDAVQGSASAQRPTRAAQQTTSAVSTRTPEQRDALFAAAFGAQKQAGPSGANL